VKSILVDKAAFSLGLTAPDLAPCSTDPRLSLVADSISMELVDLATWGCNGHLIYHLTEQLPLPTPTKA